RYQGASCATFAHIATPPPPPCSALFPYTTLFRSRVRATDAAANLSAYSNVSSGTVADTQAPTAPANLTAAVSGSQINLSWTASRAKEHTTEHKSLAYQVGRRAPLEKIATPTTTTF